MRKFSKTSHHDLHDGVIISALTVKDFIIIQFDGGLDLIFRGVKYVNSLNSIINDSWLYDEVHLSVISNFEYHVLLEKSELIIKADEVKLIEY